MRRQLRSFAAILLFTGRRRHTRLQGDWSSDVCSSDLCFAKRDDRLPRIFKVHPRDRHGSPLKWEDRKSVVEGKSVDLGGRRIIKKNNATMCSPNLILITL